MPMVDTLRLKTRLSESGMPESQAQVLVEELDEALTMAVTGQVATKADIAEVKADIADVKVELAELRGAISAVEEKVGGSIKTVEEKLSGAIKTVEEKLSGDIRVLRWMGGTLVVIQLGILAKLLFP